MSWHHQDPDDGGDDGGWPEDEFDEEEYENFIPEPDDDFSQRQPSLKSRTVPPLPPASRESASMPAIQPRNQLDISEKLKHALQERASMHKSAVPSPVTERPSPRVPTATKATTAANTQRQLPTVPSIPPPLPPIDREDSADDTYEAPDDFAVNKSTNNKVNSSSSQGLSRPLPPVPQLAGQQQQQQQPPVTKNSRPLPPVPPQESFEEDEYVAVEPDECIQPPKPTQLGVNRRSVPPLPVISKSPVPPPLPAYDDEEEYVEADPDPPPVRVPNNRRAMGLPAVPTGNQNRPIPSLPGSAISKTPKPVIAITNIASTEDDECEYEGNECYVATSPPVGNVPNSSNAKTGPTLPSRSPMATPTTSMAPTRQAGKILLPNRSASDVEKKRTQLPPVPTNDQPESTERLGRSGRLKSSSSDASDLASSRSRPVVKHSTSQLSSDDRSSQDADGVNTPNILECKNRLKKVTPQSESTKPTSPARRADNTIPALPSAKITPPPSEPARLTPTRRTESPGPPKTSSVLPPSNRPTAGLKQPSNTLLPSLPPGNNASDRNSDRSVDTSPQRGAASPVKSRNGYAQSPVRNAVTANKQPHGVEVTRSSSNAGPKRPLPPVDGEVEQEGLYSFSWYFASIDRKVAEEKLRSVEQNGTFMIRRSQKGGSSNPFSVSIFYNDYVYNLHLRKRPDQKYAIGSEKPDEMAFTTVPELVTFYKSNFLELIGDTRRNISSGRVMLKSSPSK